MRNVAIAIGFKKVLDICHGTIRPACEDKLAKLQEGFTQQEWEDYSSTDPISEMKGVDLFLEIAQGAYPHIDIGNAGGVRDEIQKRIDFVPRTVPPVAPVSLPAAALSEPELLENTFEEEDD